MRHLTQLRYIDVVAREGSIRKAAEKLSITSTALNRRILALEDEIGTPLFERLPGGVRLNTAGELFIQHVRLQITDLSRVLSHIADLSGIRRGNVRIGAGPEIVGAFLPTQVSDYRKQHSAVTFEIVRMGSEETLASLRSLDIDIGIIFDSVLPSDVQIVATAIQQLNVIMSATHPLAEKKQLRLQDCAAYPIILPRTTGGIRTLIDVGLLRSSVTLEQTILSDSYDFMTNYISHEEIIGFQIPLGMSPYLTNRQGVVHRPIDSQDVPSGLIHIVQSKGRVLPVAAAKFMDQIVQNLHLEFEDNAR